MIFINNISYSFESLKRESIKILKNSNLEDWEKSFWQFINDWFNKDLLEIEVKTSGSTGKPKIIKHYKKYMIASAKMTCNYFKLSENKTALLCLPTTSIGGMMMVVRSLVSKMKLIVVKPSSMPLKFLNTKIDFTAMVPFQVQNTIIENIEKWKKIDTLIIGGGRISNSLKDDIVNLKINAFNTFGMTETISHIALKRIGENNYFSALENCFFSQNDNSCLIIHANNLGLTALETNDIVQLINEKQFIWLGRKDLAIETGGIKVIPELIEKKIEHLIKSRFFIASKPDKLLNNKLILLVESKIEKISLENMKRFLAKYENPKEIIYLNRFIETKTGKISRKLTLESIEL